MLPTVFANAAVSLYAVGHLFLTRFRALPVAALFLANPPSFFVQAAMGGRCPRDTLELHPHHHQHHQ
ncbi:hypothetical protein [Methanogenium cariaci]|uniref:hypothetical protein n=1 Tax=Methanogenium cariaci TaxID=2197 RepID=UPI000784527C|nr:hypothetical protein [Methanogenium cariaci]